MSRLGLVPLAPGRAAEEALAIMDHFADRWDPLIARIEGPLHAASDAMMDADAHLRTRPFPEPAEEAALKATFAASVRVLEEGGEEAVPFLAMSLLAPGWSESVLAEAVSRMPAGPRRDRALVEVLFTHVPEAARIAANAWMDDAEPSRAWTVVEALARECAEADIELTGAMWLVPFLEVEPEAGVAVAPRGGLGPALALLHELGHFDALRRAIDFFLNPALDGNAGVERFLEDAGLASTLAGLRPGRLRVAARTAYRYLE